MRNGTWIHAIANVPIQLAMTQEKQKAAENGLLKDGKTLTRRAVNRVGHQRISLPDWKPQPFEIIGNESDMPLSRPTLRSW